MESTSSVIPSSSSSSSLRKCNHLSLAQHHLWAHHNQESGGVGEDRGGAQQQGPLHLSGHLTGSKGPVSVRPIYEDVGDEKGSWIGHSGDAMMRGNRQHLPASAPEMIRRRQMMRNIEHKSWPVPSDYSTQTACRSTNNR